jgi:hypothetical protein
MAKYRKVINVGMAKAPGSWLKHEMKCSLAIKCFAWL